MSRCGGVTRAAAALSVVVVAAVSGCSPATDPATPAPGGATSASTSPPTEAAPTPTAPTSAAPTPAVSTPAAPGTAVDQPSRATSAASTAAVRAAMDCLHGRWTMASFAMEAEKSVTTSGDGGDVVFSFDDDRWQLWGRGQEPVTVSIGRREAEISVDGWAKGEMAAQPGGVRYQVEETSGSVAMAVDEGAEEHPIPLEHFLGTMVPTGPTGIDCSAERATISSLNASVNQVLILQR